ncbi:bifunctional DNA primase/polymerase [Corynebacterium sp. AOP12-C2-36]|uniref:bifunctional DNA primase/polymerase n=1 Tax=Corynebacterium sp. AOP12-C2-36 TaxID=3457723 RepID=UPI0040341D34
MTDQPDQDHSVAERESAPAAEQVTALLAAGNADTLTTTRQAAADYIGPLVAAGLPVIPLVPGEKRPALLSNWQRTPVTTEAWSGWLDAAFSQHSTGTPALGIGLRAGNRMIVADADTPEEVDALQAFLRERGLPDAGPTVSTPGTADGTHHGGGHWWFVLPDTDPIPAGLPGVLAVDASGRTGRAAQEPTFDLFLHSKQAALPPTLRDGGAYQLTGAVHPLPGGVLAWLREQGIAARAANTAAATRRAERASAQANPALEAWEDEHDWTDLLTPAGWTETGTDAGCGCPQFRHPEASSAKSATAHDCSRGMYLHLWSTSCRALEAGSWSKLYVDAALRHGGSYAAAAQAAGLPSKPTAAVPGLNLKARMAEITQAAGQGAQAGRIEQAVGQPGHEQPTAMFDETAYPLGHPNDPELLERIFGYSDATRELYHTARSRTLYNAPVGLLLGELVRVAETSGVGTGYVTDGKLVRLSTYVIVAANSGSGKSVVMRGNAGMRRRGFQGNLGDVGSGVERGSVASGQAVVDMLVEDVMETDDAGEPTGKKIVAMRDPAVATVQVDEIASLLANKGTSEHLTDTLLTAWSGDQIGERSRTHQRRQTTGPYLLNMVGGIQPARAGVLVGREATASGLAQRLFLCSVADPWFRGLRTGAIIERIAHGNPGALAPIPVNAKVEMPDASWEALAEDQFAAAEESRAPGDGHLLMVRMRMAALTALWHGSTTVTGALWQWSAHLMEHHLRTRAAVTRGAETAAQDEADEGERRRENARLEARDAAADVTAEVAAALLEKLPAEGVTGGKWRANLSRGRRRFFDTAVTELLNSGQVVGEPAGTGGVRYRRVGG